MRLAHYDFRWVLWSLSAESPWVSPSGLTLSGSLSHERVDLHEVSNIFKLAFEWLSVLSLRDCGLPIPLAFKRVLRIHLLPRASISALGSIGWSAHQVPVSISLSDHSWVTDKSVVDASYLLKYACTILLSENFPIELAPSDGGRGLPLLRSLTLLADVTSLIWVDCFSRLNLFVNLLTVYWVTNSTRWKVLRNAVTCKAEFLRFDWLKLAASWRVLRVCNWLVLTSMDLRGNQTMGLVGGYLFL